MRVLEKCGYTPFHFFWVAKNSGYAIHSRSFSSLQLLGQKCPLEAINVFLLVTHSEINAWDGKPLITQFLVYIIIICMVIDPLRN